MLCDIMIWEVSFGLKFSLDLLTVGKLPDHPKRETHTLFRVIVPLNYIITVLPFFIIILLLFLNEKCFLLTKFSLTFADADPLCGSGYKNTGCLCQYW
jgi:hypothetical protein